MRALARNPTETLVGVLTVVVSAAAVFVSVQANRIADRQAQIAERQTRLTQQQLQPIITAALRWRFRHGTVTSESVEVTNDGAPAGGFQVGTIMLLLVTYERGSRPAVRRAVPVEGYFGNAGWTGAAKGHIAVVDDETSRGNAYALDVLETKCAEFARRSDVALSFGRARYLEVAYTDQLGERHREYLRLPEVGASEPVSAAVARRLAAVKNDFPLRLDDATPEDVYHRARESDADVTAFD